MASSFGLAIYVSLCHSKAIGVLLIVALLASMTQITESFAAGSCTVDTIQGSMLFDGTDLTTINDVANAGACGTACCNNASCKAFTYNSQNKNCHLKNGNITSTAGGAHFSGAKVTRTADEKATSVENPPPGDDVDRPKNGGSKRSDPASDTKKETSVPKPTMSCNLENFASY
jgi:hypothetical protein